MSERSLLYAARSRFTKKNAFQMHSEHEDTIRMEKAFKSVWLLWRICLYILIASSFSFISSETWLPNGHIDYLSRMHISQLQAIKACKISTTSGPRSGFQIDCEQSHQLSSSEYQLQGRHLPTTHAALLKCHNPLQGRHNCLSIPSMRKQRLRTINNLAQGHTISKWQSRDLNSCVTSNSMGLSATYRQ